MVGKTFRAVGVTGAADHATVEPSMAADLHASAPRGLGPAPQRSQWVGAVSGGT